MQVKELSAALVKTNLFHLCTLTLATHALPLMMYSCNIIVHHVPKCISCHKAIVIYIYIYRYIYIYITYICIYLYLIYSVYKFTKNCHSDTTPPSDQREIARTRDCFWHLLLRRKPAIMTECSNHSSSQ